VKLTTVTTGDVFGEMSMIDTAPRSATIIAQESCSLLAFPRDAFFALLREDPTLSVKFLWGLSQEMNKRIRRLSNTLVGAEEPINQERTGGKLPFLYTKDIQ
jgi:CRP-like cAMP-binding protein